MKLNEFKPILRSIGMGAVQWAIVWDSEKCEDIVNGCSIEYAIANFGECEVQRISAYESKLVIEL